MKLKTAFWMILIGFLLLGCREEAPAPTIVPEASIDQATEAPGTNAQLELPAPVEVTLEPTPIPPTPTPIAELAARVNGEPLFLADYESELARFEQSQAVLGTNDPNYQTTVLDALITQMLILQAAEAAGISVTEAEVTASLEEYRALANERGNFEEWLEENLWTEEAYREVLATELVEARMVERVTENVPRVADQVHARYLQVEDAALAEQLLTQIRNGDDFALLAQQHSLDRLTGENGGDIGYFAQGSLLVPEVETAAFALQPGEVSDVIAAGSIDGSGTVYYLVQVIERDEQRPLPANYRYELLQKTFQSWLDAQWQDAVIERYVE